MGDDFAAFPLYRVSVPTAMEQRCGGPTCRRRTGHTGAGRSAATRSSLDKILLGRAISRAWRSGERRVRLRRGGPAAVVVLVLGQQPGDPIRSGHLDVEPFLGRGGGSIVTQPLPPPVMLRATVMPLTVVGLSATSALRLPGVGVSTTCVTRLSWPGASRAAVPDGRTRSKPAKRSVSVLRPGAMRVAVAT